MSTQNFPKFLWFRCLCLASRVFSLFIVFEKQKDSKLKGAPKLLNNNKKGG